MKSLEIVNALLATMKIADNIDLNDCEEYFEKIKQDLEVLEILKEHLVLIPTGTNKEQLFIATDITNYLSEKDKEDFNKLKQWLEVNKNEKGN